MARIYIIRHFALAVLLACWTTAAAKQCGPWAPQSRPIVPPSGVNPMTDPTDIPTCGKSPAWNCADHPLLEPAAYCNAIKAGSKGACPVQYEPMTSLYALMHYFYPGTNSYSVLTPPPGTKAPYRRDSWGYQYYSLEHEVGR